MAFFDDLGNEITATRYSDRTRSRGLFEFTVSHFGFAIVMLLVFVLVFSVLAGMV